VSPPIRRCTTSNAQLHAYVIKWILCVYLTIYDNGMIHICIYKTHDVLASISSLVEEPTRYRSITVQKRQVVSSLSVSIALAIVKYHRSPLKRENTR